MSSVKMGDASIRVTIDPQAAKAEADRLKKELQKLDEIRKKTQEELERAFHGEKPLGATKPDPNAPGGQRVKPVPGAAGGEEQKEKAKKTSGQDVSERIGGYFSKVYSAVKVASDAASAGSGLTSYLKGLVKGTPFESRVIDGVDHAAQRAAEHLNKLDAGRSAFHDTVTDVVDYNMAALKLGGKIPVDQDKIVKDFAEINYQQNLLRANINLATKRTLMETLPKAFAATFNR